jgi:capsular polysaccharide transport system ATP-binding protein
MGFADQMIQFNNVFKFYRTHGHTKVVLNHVSMLFDTTRSYGLLGVNGAGKSTTLRLIAGTELPNSGSVRRTVRVSWPLGFSGTFHPQMTGRENVVFLARVYGADIRRTIDFVEDFAEIGDYMDVPVKTYSSGMGARLAFGLSMAVEFDVYLIDESLSVGDAFAARRKNASIIMVSHSMGDIKRYCDCGGVIVEGQILMFDNPDKAIETYNRLNR